MGVIYYNGVPSTFYGIQVETQPGYLVPEKDVEVIHVPGRNGDLIIDKGVYQNVNREYSISCVTYEREFDSLVQAINTWLHPGPGYFRLEDTYDPEFYREAICKDEVDIENFFGHGAKTTLTFNCKPQKYLKSGEDPRIFESAGTLRNPTLYVAKPLIKVYGSGSGVLTIGSYVVSLTAINEYVIIDSELMDVYKEQENKNSTATLADGFPLLNPGSNGILFSGGITKVQITPRWWSL